MMIMEISKRPNPMRLKVTSVGKDFIVVGIPMVKFRGRLPTAITLSGVKLVY